MSPRIENFRHAIVVHIADLFLGKELQEACSRVFSCEIIKYRHSALSKSADQYLSSFIRKRLFIIIQQRDVLLSCISSLCALLR